jgi:hypothetical protein
MSEQARQFMIPESCKVIGAGLAALLISKKNFLALVTPAAGAEIKLFLEIVVLTFTAIYTGARTCAWLWARWTWWKNRKSKNEES